jgi:hypothetical protein
MSFRRADLRAASSPLQRANSPLQRAKARLAEQSSGSYQGSPGAGHYLGPAPPPLFTPPSTIRRDSYSHQSDAGTTDIDAAAESHQSHDFYATEADAVDASVRDTSVWGAYYSDENATNTPQGSRPGEAATRLLSPAERSFAATAFEPYATQFVRDFAEASLSMEQQEEHEKQEHVAAFFTGASVGASPGSDCSGDRSGGDRSGGDRSGGDRSGGGGWRVEALLEAVLATQASQAAQLSALREAMVHFSVTLDHLTSDVRPELRPGASSSSPDLSTTERQLHSADRTEEPPSEGLFTDNGAAVLGPEPTAAPAPERGGHLEEEALAENREGAAAGASGARAGDAAAAAPGVAAVGVGALALALAPPVRVLAANPPAAGREMKPLGRLAAATAAELRAVGFTAHNCLAAGLAPRDVRRRIGP